MPSGEEGGMRARRDLVRAVVPPLLALGLVTLLVRPVDSVVPRGPIPPAPVSQRSVAPSDR